MGLDRTQNQLTFLFLNICSSHGFENASGILGGSAAGWTLQCENDILVYGNGKYSNEVSLGLNRLAYFESSMYVIVTFVTNFSESCESRSQSALK